MCTICIPNGASCATHLVWTERPRGADRTNSAVASRWHAKHGDDIRALKEQILAGEIDFAQLEMV